ncbi:menaquinone biosynthesis protein [Thermocrinis minervae]|uniref:Chorismate dehydratase n=1 Tax=Thermocrinis minervae TaxID=381751 RepID=A0A1M6TAX1_9AQUI|nr:menaquinone biosynthesis protein [Thermocrinis minervae]SHK54121.1 chorismate dehydratase [Thermocrinis minervae]
MKYRVGKVAYLNTLPLFYRWDAPEVELVDGHPSDLVRKLRYGEIHAGIVSSVEYLMNSHLYTYVPDVSISSRDRVCSVLLFSKTEISSIKTVYLTSNSLTSRLLCIHILEDVYGISPNYTESMSQADAILLIGDEALSQKRLGLYPFVYDLGHEWKKAYNLPFVFALFLVRKEYHPELTEIIHRLCLVSKEVFYRDLKEGKISSQLVDVNEYFLDCLHLGLGPAEERSLELFMKILERRGYIRT